MSAACACAARRWSSTATGPRRPHAQGAALAEVTGGSLVTFVGAGHLPELRDPVKVNLLLREFLCRRRPMTTSTQARAEQTRALCPDRSGYVERAGVRIAWERYGSGERAVLLLPTWEIAHSRMWKCQIPFLAQRFTVITYDPRGNGRSDRPANARAYDRAERALDTRAVLDAAGIERATVVSWCGAEDDLAFAVAHPERIEALVLIAPDLLLTQTPNEAMYDSIPDW